MFSAQNVTHEARNTVSVRQIQYKVIDMNECMNKPNERTRHKGETNRKDGAGDRRRAQRNSFPALSAVYP